MSLVRIDIAPFPDMPKDYVVRYDIDMDVFVDNLGYTLTSADLLAKRGMFLGERQAFCDSLVCGRESALVNAERLESMEKPTQLQQQHQDDTRRKQLLLTTT